MPELKPFSGLRPDPAVTGPLDDFVCPPYDVINEQQRLELLKRSPYNFVRLELPAGDYAGAAALFERWKASGVLAREKEQALYLYRMSYELPSGAKKSTLGVIGALTLEPLGRGVLPHEETTPKAKSDRLELIRALRANTSPVWCLCPEPGLSESLREALSDQLGELPGEAPTEPLLPAPETAKTSEPAPKPARALEPAPKPARAYDPEGNLHELWPVFDTAIHEAVTKVISSAPLLIADGHHRYETALAYHSEQLGRGDSTGGHGALMALVVGLAAADLSIFAIHRVVSQLPAGTDPLSAFKPGYEISPAAASGEAILTEMEARGAVGVVTPACAFLAKPVPGAPSAAYALDSERVDAALASLPPHHLVYEHDVQEALRAVREGKADAAVFCRPPRVDQIARAAHGRERMPAKTTFFWPKPRSGMVVRDW